MELLISVSRLRLDRKSKQSLAFNYVNFFVGTTCTKALRNTNGVKFSIYSGTSLMSDLD